MPRDIVPRVFSDAEFSVRAFRDDDGSPWFLAMDVCGALALSNTTNALRRVKDSDKGCVRLRDGSSGNPRRRTVSEKGAYELANTSGSQRANDFMRFMAHSVIPSLRGESWRVPPSEAPEQTIARALVIAQRILESQSQEIGELRRNAFFAEAVRGADTSISVSELAKILSKNGYSVNVTKLYKRLVDDGFVIGSKGREYHMPTQRSVEQDLFEIAESVYTHQNGHTSIHLNPLVTGKGQVFFVNKYCNKEVSE